MVDDRTDADLIAELEDMFGSGSEEEQEEAEGSEDVDETEETDDETDSSEEETDSEETSEEEDESSKDTEDVDHKKSQQNYAFAEMRTQNKKLTGLIKNLGKALGLDEKATVDDVASKVQTALLQKQSKESKIPVEYLERMQALEVIAQEAERTKVEKQVSDDLTSLSEKYNLSKDELRDFAVALSEKGKNPLEVQGVDIESEYIKMHQQDIIDKAVEKALSEDKARRDKADKHAGGKVPHNAGEDKDKAKIETIADLSKALDDLA